MSRIEIRSYVLGRMARHSYVMIYILAFFGAFASAADLDVPVSTAYLNAQTEITTAICRDESAFRRCKFTETSACHSAVDAAFTDCYRKDLSTRKGSAVSVTEAKELSQRLLECTVKAPSFKATDALQNACFAKAARANEKVNIDVSYLRNYQMADAPPKSPVAQSTPQPVLDLATRYLVYTKNSADSMVQLRAGLKANPKAACPNYKGRDHSGCALEAFKRYPARTATDLTLGAVILTVEAVRDRETLGAPEAEGRLYTNLAAYLESVDFTHFWILTEPATVQFDEMQRRDLIKLENESLAKAKEKIAQSLNKPGRKPASVEAARQRLRNALSRQWLIR